MTAAAIGTSSVRHRPVRTPGVLQMEVTECGAAGLAMILNYYGKHVLLEEVREACAVGRDGVNALKIVDAAELYGLNAKGMRYSLEELYQLKGPFIVFWNQNHFLVVEGFTRRRVYLNDPASGRRTVSHETFAESYSGITLVFRPGDRFQPSGRGVKAHPVLDMLRLLGRSRSGVFYAVIAGVAVVVPTTVAAALTSVFVSQVLEAGYTSWVAAVVLLAVGVMVAQFALILFQQRVLLRLQTKLSIRMSGQMLWHMLHLPTRFFDARSLGGLVSRVQLNAQVAQLLSGSLATAGVSAITMAIYGGILLILNWKLGLVALAVASLNAFILFAVSRSRVSVNQNLQQTLNRLYGYTFLGVNLVEDIKATGSENDFFGRWAGTHARALNVEQNLSTLTQLLLIAPTFLNYVNIVVILAVGGTFVIDHSISLAVLITFFMLSQSFFAPIAQLVSVASQFQDARAWLQQINDVRAQPLDKTAVQRFDAREAQALAETDWGRLSGRVELRHVTFGYVPGEPPLINDLSIIIEPGQRVAFVGPSGSGKSTVANLVVGLLHPWSGEVLFDGRRREDIPPEVMGASMAKVDQNIMLFSGTVADNIRFFDDSIVTREVVRAAEDACIAQEIEEKPGGYAHMVGEGGRNFSGGQRQRLELARALAGTPTIVILDEATSALDAVTEKEIDTNLRRRGCTSIIIAHRLSTIRDCDQIVVLDRGAVAERGIHEELVVQEGIYHGLVTRG